METQFVELDSNGKCFLEKIPTFMRETFDLKDFKILSWVPVLYPAWELDNWAAIIQMPKNRKKILLHTDHGAVIQVENPEQFLSERIDSYQLAIDESRDALSILAG